MKASDLFDFPESLPFKKRFSSELPPWEWVSLIKDVFGDLDEEDCLAERSEGGLSISGKVWIHESVSLPPFGSIQGPAFIAKGCEIRPGVYIRGNVIAGAGCVLGNSCEFKNCLLLEGVQVPHFSYVGDSILGNNAHLGAGVICSNLRLDQAPVKVKEFSGSIVSSERRKLGALIGDGAEVGCNAVLNPGVILGRRSLVMPTVAFRGTLRETLIAFENDRIKVVARPD